MLKTYTTCAPTLGERSLRPSRTHRSAATPKCGPVASSACVPKWTNAFLALENLSGKLARIAPRSLTSDVAWLSD